MIARNKSEKTDHSKYLFFHLWHGKTEEREFGVRSSEFGVMIF